MDEPVTITASASDGVGAVDGVGEGDDRAIVSCPRALAAIERDAIKQNRWRQVIGKILSGFPSGPDSNKPIK